MQRRSTSKSNSRLPSVQPRRPPVFALDENFPQPILLQIVARVTPEIELQPIRAIDARFTGGLADHRLILALYEVGIEGMVTNDDSMLYLPEVLAIVEQTGFTLVTCRRTGHDALVATGPLLAHLGRIGRRHQAGVPQVWRLAASDRGPEDLSALISETERRAKRRVADYRLTPAQLGKPVL